MNILTKFIGKLLRIHKYFSSESDVYLLYDRTMLWMLLGLMCVGFIMVSSGSIPVGIRLLNDPFYFIKREIFYYSITILASLVVLNTPVVAWKNFSVFMLLFSYVMLLISLIFNHSINGASRWIMWGSLCMQPAELSKLSFINYLACYISRKSKELCTNFWGICKPIVVMTLLNIFLLVQPDFGSVIIIFFTTLFILFLFGAKLYQLMIVFILHALLIILLVLCKPYRIQRMLVFWDPWKDPFGHGYQLTQSLMAFGRGEYFGQGLGNSIQKMEYLPEAHTDFIFSIISEELGCIGAILILFMLFVVVFRAMMIGFNALRINQKFSGILSCSISIWLALQIFINIGSVSGILPTKGLTLPFISYGGSSFIITVIANILLLRIDFEVRLIERHAFLNDEKNEKNKKKGFNYGRRKRRTRASRTNNSALFN